MLAVATTLPAASAAITGRRLTIPPVPTTTRSTSSRVASSLERVGAADELLPAGGRAPARRVVGDDHDGRPQPRGLLGQQRGCAPGRQGDHPERVGMGGQDVEGLTADGAGGAEERDPDGAAPRRPRSPDDRDDIQGHDGAAKRNESTRSRIPPWPGISLPESFAPAARLSIDSARSPAWAASGDHGRGGARPGRPAEAAQSIAHDDRAATTPPMSPA